MTWRPLLETKRAGIADVVVHGAIAWATPARVVHEVGGDVVCWGRSMLKPLMAKPLAEKLAAVTNWDQRAIAVASHMGTAMHVDIVRSLSAEASLQLPASRPLVLPGDPPSSQPPDRAQHPCSGQHA